MRFFSTALLLTLCAGCSSNMQKHEALASRAMLAEVELDVDTLKSDSKILKSASHSIDQKLSAVETNLYSLQKHLDRSKSALELAEKAEARASLLEDKTRDYEEEIHQLKKDIHSAVALVEHYKKSLDTFEKKQKKMCYDLSKVDEVKSKVEALHLNLAKDQSSPDMTVHTVRASDSLEYIARKYGVSKRALEKINGISDESTLKPGTKLKVPNPKFQ